MDRARDLQGEIFWPSVKYYKNILSNNQIINTRVTVDGIKRAEAIYVTRVAILKGKMVRKRPQHVHNVPLVPLPNLLLYHHKNEHLVVDFMFVNVHIFLITISFNIKFISIMDIQGRGATESTNALKTTISASTAKNQHWDCSRRQQVWGITQIINTIKRWNIRCRLTQGPCGESRTYR